MLAIEPITISILVSLAMFATSTGIGAYQRNKDEERIKRAEERAKIDAEEAKRRAKMMQIKEHNLKMQQLAGPLMTAQRELLEARREEKAKDRDYGSPAGPE